MNIPINKDFEHDYRETVYKGFTLHEAKYALAGLVLIVSVCLFLWRYIGISPVLAVYISVPVGAPIMIAGFWQSKNGLTLREHLAAVKYRKATAMLHYRAGEYQPGTGGMKASKVPKCKTFNKQNRLHPKYVRACLRQQRKERRGASE